MTRRDPQQFARLVRVRRRQADVRAYALAEAKRAVMAAQQDRAMLEAQQREILARMGEALAGNSIAITSTAGVAPSNLFGRGADKASPTTRLRLNVAPGIQPKSRSSTRAGEIDIPQVRQYTQYERHLAARAVEADSQIRLLEAEAETRRGALEEAVKARRMAEKLLERAEEQAAANARRAEQMALDEIASVRSARNRIRSAERIRLRETG